MLLPEPHNKSFGRAFSKARGFLGQSPKSRSAERETPFAFKRLRAWALVREAPILKSHPRSGYFFCTPKAEKIRWFAIAKQRTYYYFTLYNRLFK